MPKWEIQWVQDILWHLEKIEGWKCKSFIDSSQEYLNNEYIVIKRVKKAYDECSSVFTQKVNSIKEESWRIEKWVWGYKKWMIKKQILTSKRNVE